MHAISRASLFDHVKRSQKTKISTYFSNSFQKNTRTQACRAIERSIVREPSNLQRASKLRNKVHPANIRREPSCIGELPNPTVLLVDYRSMSLAEFTLVWLLSKFIFRNCDAHGLPGEGILIDPITRIQISSQKIDVNIQWYF